MMDDDEFGRDPAVRSMRRVFAQMEIVQHRMLEAVALSPFDRRIGVWREQTLHLFEKTWRRAGKTGLTRTEEEVAILYAHCLARILERGRVMVPVAALTRNDDFERLIEEIVK
jgi:hypothetical protein